jgi:hypothetical protein
MSENLLGVRPPTSFDTREWRRELRRADVLLRIKDLLSLAVEEFGLDDARGILQDAAGALARKRGRPPKTGPSAKDSELLRLYDEVADTNRDPKSLPRAVAEYVIQHGRYRYQSVAAAEKQLKRLLERRQNGKSPLPRTKK